MTTQRMLTLGLAATAATLLAAAPRAAAVHIIVAENATYRYVNATAETTIDPVPGDWFEPSFDASTWFVGQGAFGTGFGADLANAAEVGAEEFPGGTVWSTNADPYLRTTFSLTEPTALTVWIAVDNGIQSLYLNGVLSIGNVNLEGAAFRWEHVFDVDASLTQAGENTVALQLEDHGGFTAFAMLVTTDDDAINPPFATTTTTSTSTSSTTIDVSTSVTTSSTASSTTTSTTSTSTTLTTMTSTSSTTSTTLGGTTIFPEGTKLLVKQKKSGRQRLQLIAKGPEIATDPGADPPCQVDGALVIEAMGAGAPPTTFPLDAALWRPIRRKKPEAGCKYRKGPVVATVQIKAGKMLKVVANADDLGIPLATDPRPVRISVRHGEVVHCFEFGGVKWRHRPNKKLLARRASPAATCPGQPGG
jgi:hypothetical protein